MSYYRPTCPECDFQFAGWVTVKAYGRHVRKCIERNIALGKKRLRRSEKGG